MPTLVLIRHGESTWNQAHRVQGQLDDAVLTVKGRSQALDAVPSLREFSFDAVITSDLRRAVETATIIGEALSLESTTTTTLRERSYGVYEGNPMAELPRAVAGFAAGSVHDADARPENGESLHDLYDRSAAYVDQLILERTSERLLLVTHGGVIRAMRAYCAGVTMDGLDWDDVDNCTIWPLDLTFLATSTKGN